MSDKKRDLNLAARAERWSALHWKTAVFGWLAFAIVAVTLGGAVGTNKLKDSEVSSGESAVAQRYLEDGDFESPASEQVLIQSRSATVDDPGFRAAIEDAVRRLGRERVVKNLVSPLSAEGIGQVSADRRSALIPFDLRGDSETAEERIDPVLDAVAAVRREHRDLFVGQFGQASAKHQLAATVEKDTQRAEMLSLPITLAILVVAFGALVAAGLPVLLGLSAVLAATGVSTLVSHLVPSDNATQAVIVLIGMAVGIDYALFYLRRERQERAAGVPVGEALTRTAATSGQAVLISGATVFIAMAGMLFAGNKIFTSIGVGAMVVVAMAMIGSLTVLPALMSKLGDRVDRGRVPFVGRRKPGREDGAMWAAILRPVLRHPAVSAGVAAAALLVLAIPAFSLHTKLPSFTDLPKKVTIVESYKRIQAAFPGAQTPAVVVVKASDVRANEVQHELFDMQWRATATGRMFQPIQVQQNAAHTVATVSIPVAGSGDDAASNAALKVLRDEVIPNTIGGVPGVKVAVTGQTAGTGDFNEQMKTSVPIVFGFVLALAFLLLLVTFRSVVIPLKAIVLNLLSVGAAYGILAAVFEHEWAEGLLGFNSNGAIASWLPLFLFVLLFGLSMDYHVFILSRVKELVAGGMRTEQAVAEGIRSTAGTVTSAAIVMVAVFAIFATNASLDTKQMGFGLAVAVLLDATVVRAVLLPATMKLLGEWNWYLPRWLEWLPHVQLEAGPAPALAIATGQPSGVAAAPGVARPVSDAPARPSVDDELEFETSTRPGGIQLSLFGELTLVTADRLAKRLQQEEATRPPELVLDLRQLRFLDSAGLRELVSAHKRAQAQGRRVTLLKAPGPIERILAISGLAGSIETVDAVPTQN
ncbi:MAG TPA: anti-sigma factor antagonist [Solirubrobacteraceae bacterium]|jgi:RND superfamily putative drug exporter